MQLTLVTPELDDLWFREELMADEETMSYNAKWGGTIPFPKEEWETWYEAYVKNMENNRFYRYLMNSQNEYVGEIAYHYDRARDIYICHVLILSKYRTEDMEQKVSGNYAKQQRRMAFLFCMMILRLIIRHISYS